MLDMQQAAEHVLFLAERHGLKEVDALIEREDALEVEIREGKVEKVEQSTSLGLGVRVLRDGKTGLASTERLDADAIERAFQSALENSELQNSKFPAQTFFILTAQFLQSILKISLYLTNHAAS